MKYRFLICILALALCLSGTGALAELQPWDLPALGGQQIQRSLVRAYGDGYEYFTYEPTTFDVAGIMGGISLDLDNDGEDEYLSVVLEANQAVTLNVHDRCGGSEWQHTAGVQLYKATLSCNIQANDIFLKHNGYNWVIFSENWIQENGVADGAAWGFQAFAYGDNSLVSLNDLFLDGTDIYGTLEQWRTDASLAQYRPELADVAAEIDAYAFDIEGLYWGNPICEQDSSLTVISRLMSVQDIAYDRIWRFTSANGSSLEGFRSIIVDCSSSGYILPVEYYLSSNVPASYEEPDNDPSMVENESYYADEFIIPDSGVRKLTADELSAYDKDTLALIRNEILARYGYPFQKQIYRDYFGEKSWYNRNESFTYGMLTSLEMENIELIKKLEAK